MTLCIWCHSNNWVLPSLVLVRLGPGLAWSRSGLVPVRLGPGPGLVPGPWSWSHGPLSMVPGPWSLVRGPWSHGPWSQSVDLGPWPMVRGPGPWSLVPGPGPWYMVHGTGGPSEPWVLHQSAPYESYGGIRTTIRRRISIRIFLDRSQAQLRPLLHHESRKSKSRLLIWARRGGV